MLLSPRSLTLTALFALLLFSGFGDPKQKKAQVAPPPLSVETVTVYKKPMPLWIQYTGMTKASSDQEICAHVSGRLQKSIYNLVLSPEIE